MTVSALYTLTDDLAKTNSTMFPTAEKLRYFNIAKDLLYVLLAREQEDRHEEEYTKTTVADQREYQEKARIHHVNWLKIDYGEGFIPARYVSEAELVSRFGTGLEDTLSTWDKSDPIYFWKGKHLFVVPAPTAAQAGANRLKTSQELYPADLVETTDEADLPIALQHLLAVYAAWRYHDNNGEDAQAAKRASELPAGMISIRVDAASPRARQAELIASVPDNDDSD
jgi:hypothetical protein